MASALSLPGQGHLTAEAGDNGWAVLMSREGRNLTPVMRAVAMGRQANPER